MAIVLMPNPPSSPSSSIADYQKQNDLLLKLLNNINYPEIVIGSNIRNGAIINVKGLLYFANSNTAISGTASKYVKITQSGDTLTCSASFAANLSGVSWNDVYNGYYDSSNNLYLFNESTAIYDGLLSYGNTELNNPYNSRYRIFESNNIHKVYKPQNYGFGSYSLYPVLLKAGAIGTIKVGINYRASINGENIILLKNNDILLNKTVNAGTYTDYVSTTCLYDDKFRVSYNMANMSLNELALMGDIYVY